MADEDRSGVVNMAEAVGAAIRTFDATAERPCMTCRRPTVGTLCALCAKADADREWQTAVRAAVRAVEPTVPIRHRWAFTDGRQAAPGAPCNRVRRPAAGEEMRARVVRPGGPVDATVVGGSAGGKTTLAVWALGVHLAAVACTGDELLLARAATCRFVTAFDLSDARWFQPPSAGMPRVEQDALRAAVLVIDDLGLEPRVDAIVSTIMRRAAAEQATIVTTSLTAAAVELRYGEGVARRLFARPAIRVTEAA